MPVQLHVDETLEFRSNAWNCAMEMYNKKFKRTLVMEFVHFVDERDVQLDSIKLCPK